MSLKNFEDAELEYLSIDDFNYFKSIIRDNDDFLNVLMQSIYRIAMEYSYVALDDYAKETLKYLLQSIEILQKQGIELPNVELIEQYSFDEFDGWGRSFNERYLSTK